MTTILQHTLAVIQHAYHHSVTNTEMYERRQI